MSLTSEQAHWLWQMTSARLDGEFMRLFIDAVSPDSFNDLVTSQLYRLPEFVRLFPERMREFRINPEALDLPFEGHLAPLPPELRGQSSLPSGSRGQKRDLDEAERQEQEPAAKRQNTAAVMDVPESSLPGSPVPESPLSESSASGSSASGSPVPESLFSESPFFGSPVFGSPVPESLFSESSFFGSSIPGSPFSEGSVFGNSVFENLVLEIPAAAAAVPDFADHEFNRRASVLHRREADLRTRALNQRRWEGDLKRRGITFAWPAVIHGSESFDPVPAADYALTLTPPLSPWETAVRQLRSDPGLEAWGIVLDRWEGILQQREGVAFDEWADSLSRREAELRDRAQAQRQREEDVKGRGISFDLPAAIPGSEQFYPVRDADGDDPMQGNLLSQWEQGVRQQRMRPALTAWDNAINQWQGALRQRQDVVDDAVVDVPAFHQRETLLRRRAGILGGRRWKYVKARLKIDIALRGLDKSGGLAFKQKRAGSLSQWEADVVAGSARISAWGHAMDAWEGVLDQYQVKLDEVGRDLGRRHGLSPLKKAVDPSKPEPPRPWRSLMIPLRASKPPARSSLEIDRQRQGVIPPGTSIIVSRLLRKELQDREAALRNKARDLQEEAAEIAAADIDIDTLEEMKGQEDFQPSASGRSAWEERTQRGQNSAFYEWERLNAWKAGLDRWHEHLLGWEDQIDDAKGDPDRFRDQEEDLRALGQALRDREAELRGAGAVFEAIKPFPDEAKFHPPEDESLSAWESEAEAGEQPISVWKKALFAWKRYQEDVGRTLDMVGLIKPLAIREAALRDRMKQLLIERDRDFGRDGGIAPPKKSFPYGDQLPERTKQNSWENTVKAGRRTTSDWTVALDGWEKRLDEWVTESGRAIERALLPLRQREIHLILQQERLLKLEQEVRRRGVMLDDPAGGAAAGGADFQSEEDQEHSAWEARVRARQAQASAWSAALDSWAAHLDAWQEQLWDRHPDKGVVARFDGRGQWAPGMPGAEALLLPLAEREDGLRQADEQLNAWDDDLRAEKEYPDTLGLPPFRGEDRFLATAAGPSAWEADVRAGVVSPAAWDQAMSEWEAYQERWRDALAAVQAEANVGKIRAMADREASLRNDAAGLRKREATLRAAGVGPDELHLAPFPDEGKFMPTANGPSQWEMDVRDGLASLVDWDAALTAWGTHQYEWFDAIDAAETDTGEAEADEAEAEETGVEETGTEGTVAVPPETLRKLARREEKLRNDAQDLHEREEESASDGADIDGMDIGPRLDMTKFLATESGPSQWQMQVEAGTAYPSDWQAALTELRQYLDRWQEALEEAEFNVNDEDVSDGSDDGEDAGEEDEDGAEEDRASRRAMDTD